MPDPTRVAGTPWRPTVALRTVVWRDENHRPYAGSTGCYTHPPPWPPGNWEITRFEVLEDGAVLHLWFAAIPAQASPGATGRPG